MQTVITLDDRTLLSSREAARRLGFSSDYVSRLCRSGVLSGQQFGRVWYIDEESLDSFRVAHKENKLERSTRLSAERKEEYLTEPTTHHVRSFVKRSHPVSIGSPSNLRKSVGALLVALAMVYGPVFFLISETGYSFSLRVEHRIASVRQNGLQNSAVAALQTISGSPLARSHSSVGAASYLSAPSETVRWPQLYQIFDEQTSQQQSTPTENLNTFMRHIQVEVYALARYMADAVSIPIRTARTALNSLRLHLVAFLSPSDSSVTKSTSTKEEIFTQGSSEGDVAMDTRNLNQNEEVNSKNLGLVVVPSSKVEESTSTTIARIQRNFSDEVEVRPDESGVAGVITPVFKNHTGSDYVFVLVPVQENTSP